MAFLTKHNADRLNHISSVMFGGVQLQEDIWEEFTIIPYRIIMMRNEMLLRKKGLF